eukprot:gene615-673_t
MPARDWRSFDFMVARLKLKGIDGRAPPGLFTDSKGGGAWPFLVGGVICLVNSVNERDLNLLNSAEFLFETKVSS